MNREEIAALNKRIEEVLTALRALVLKGTAEDVARAERIREAELTGAGRVTGQHSLKSMLGDMGLDRPEDFEPFVAWLLKTSTAEATSRRTTATWWIEIAESRGRKTAALELWGAFDVGRRKLGGKR